MDAIETSSSIIDHGDSQHPEPPTSQQPKPSKITLIYDVTMIILIMINLALLAVEYALHANFGWVIQLLNM